VRIAAAGSVLDNLLKPSPLQGSRCKLRFYLVVETGAYPIRIVPAPPSKSKETRRSVSKSIFCDQSAKPPKQ
jgi:hypothetical protein